MDAIPGLQIGHSGRNIDAHGPQLPIGQMIAFLSEIIEQRSAWYQFHDDHNGLLLDADTNQPHHVRMFVLLQNPPFLQRYQIDVNFLWFNRLTGQRSGT
jgi:hypothetical protein